MYFDMNDLSPQRCYQMLVNAIVPRPIAWISTKNAEGVHNLAPYSFFTVASGNPPVLSVTQVLPRSLQHKDTLANLLQTKECVVNIVDLSAIDSMHNSCANYANDVDEFAALAIEKVASEKVSVAGVAKAPVRYECRLREIITVSDKAMGGSMMLLDVLGVYANESCIKEDNIDSTMLNAIGRMGGDYYNKTDETIELKRPNLK